MATIRKRADKWQVQIRRQGFAAQSKSFNQQRDAERWAVLKERELDLLESQGLTGAKACDLTVGQLLERYRLQVLPLKRSGGREAYLVHAMERATFAKAKADRLPTKSIIAYRDGRSMSVGPATIVRELGLLQHAYEVARKDWGFESLRNPVRDVQRPKLPRGRMRRLRPGEERRLVEAGKRSLNPLLVPIMLFALETSMRLGEIVTARWDHLDRTGRVLLVPETKNDNPRTVPLSRKALAILEELPSSQCELVFPTTAEAIKRAWIRLVRRCKIEDLHFHDLRHEAISRLVERGFDLPHVMMFSGHTDHRMLLRYTHLSARKLVAKLDAVT